MIMMWRPHKEGPLDIYVCIMGIKGESHNHLKMRERGNVTGNMYNLNYDSRSVPNPFSSVVKTFIPSAHL